MQTHVTLHTPEGLGHVEMQLVKQPTAAYEPHLDEVEVRAKAEAAAEVERAKVADDVQWLVCNTKAELAALREDPEEDPFTASGASESETPEDTRPVLPPSAPSNR